jgi:F-type H+-transporting ATPase subunit O
MESLLNVMKKDAKLVKILEAPALSGDDKNGIIAELQKHTGGADKENIVKNFLHTLADNNRLSALEGVAENFAKLMGAYKGEVEMVVTSAAPLDQKVLRQLETAISKSQYVGQGKKLKVLPKVCPMTHSYKHILYTDDTHRSTQISEVVSLSKLAIEPSTSASRPRCHA